MLVSRRPSQPAPLDTRPPSPLPEKTHSTGMNRTSHGLPTPATDVPSSTFTAVNGDSQSSTSFRPNGTTSYAAPPANMTDQSRPASASYQAHPWTSDERRDDEQSRSAGAKRKRDDDSSVANHPENTSTDLLASVREAPSPRQSMSTLNSAVIPSSERSNSSRTKSRERDDVAHPLRGPYKREHTPTARTGRASPPPQARPETVSGLAASLNASLREEQQTQSATLSTSPVSTSPPGPYISNIGGDANENDPKRRKRNFSNRTKTGCHTCRQRKKKCDEGKPECLNCIKGNFACNGYGPKPAGGPQKLGAGRSVVPLQAKQHYDHAPGAPPFYDPNATRPPLSQQQQQHWPDQRPDPYASAPYRHDSHHQPIDVRPSSARESWDPGQPWPRQPDHAHTFPPERLPPPDLGVASIPTPHPYPAPPQATQPGPPPPWHPPSHEARPTLPPFSVHRPPAPPSVVSQSSSVSEGRPSQTYYNFPLDTESGPWTEKRKMMTGKPYRHFSDDELLSDRHFCQVAIERFNKDCGPTSTATNDEKRTRFREIWDPKQRPPSAHVYQRSRGWITPRGSCGYRTVVQVPFSCEFGYNINLGSSVVIQSDCFMQDTATIFIGDRTIVGPNVKFYCMTASVDHARRGEGDRGDFLAGAIRVEEDCFIGGGSIIMPFRTIGRGAVVGAGSVVTRDVKPYTVVAGNPAKLVRKRKIESGAADVDRHDDAIQEENDKMVELMKTDSVVPPHTHVMRLHDRLHDDY